GARVCLVLHGVPPGGWGGIKVPREDRGSREKGPGGALVRTRPGGRRLAPGKEDPVPGRADGSDGQEDVEPVLTIGKNMGPSRSRNVDGGGKSCRAPGSLR